MPGDVIDVSAAVAKAWVADQLAVLVREAPVEAAVVAPPPEVAVARPKRAPKARPRARGPALEPDYDPAA